MSMAEIRYTKAQQQAIYDRNGDMLVSAAAGSGKTSVLAARVSALIEEGAEIRRMLIVTFTSKAAMEMRGRIRRALEQNAREKAMPRLAMQAEQADSADICTIHSFAAKVIKENFVPLGLNAQVHAAEKNRLSFIRQKQWRNCCRNFMNGRMRSFCCCATVIPAATIRRSPGKYCTCIITV